MIFSKRCENRKFSLVYFSLKTLKIRIICDLSFCKEPSATGATGSVPQLAQSMAQRGCEAAGSVTSQLSRSTTATCASAASAASGGTRAGRGLARHHTQVTEVRPFAISRFRDFLFYSFSLFSTTLLLYYSWLPYSIFILFIT